MRFSSYDKLGAASENTDDSDFLINELNGGGKLEIYFETPSNESFFLKRDTLIKLVFNTYIGDKISTPIAFIDPLLGDGFCDKVLLPKDTNGVLRIDSICDLDLLLLPSGSGIFLIGDVQPNPVNDKINLHYELKYETNLDITIYNDLGLPVDNIYSGKQDYGIYEINYQCKSLSNGIYYLRFSNGISNIIRKLIISR
jgi:hypothetical protein